MQYSDTTNKSGGIQFCETLCGMEDGAITNDATLLKTFTMLVNNGFDEIMPLLLSYTDFIKWDDINHTDNPIGTFNIVSGTENYKIVEDTNGLDILNFTRLQYLSSATETKYKDLQRMTMDNPLAVHAMAPNSDDVGIPRYFLERGNTIYLYPQPNYSVANGVQMFFEREQSYFVSTDTTKEVGIPKPFHSLPFLYAAKRWLTINKGNEVNLIADIKNEITKKESNLNKLIKSRVPVKTRLSGVTVNAI